MWHTHILSSIGQYNADCWRICGHKFYHDDSFNDRTPGAPLEQAFAQTGRLWQQHYHESYIPRVGNSTSVGMYRGEPPASFYKFATWCATTATKAELPSNRGGSTIVSLTGATSTGSVANGGTVPLPHQHPYWRDINQESLTSTGQPLYVTAKETRNQTRGAPDPNPVRPNYVFGRGSQGWGYYSFESREAWQMVWDRLEKQKVQLEKLERQGSLLRLFRGRSTQQLEKQAALQQTVSQLRRAQEDVMAHLQTRGPGDWSATPVLQEAVGAAACGGAGIFTYVLFLPSEFDAFTVTLTVLARTWPYNWCFTANIPKPIGTAATRVTAYAAITVLAGVAEAVAEAAAAAAAGEARKHYKRMVLRVRAVSRRINKCHYLDLGPRIARVSTLVTVQQSCIATSYCTRSLRRLEWALHLVHVLMGELALAPMKMNDT